MAGKVGTISKRWSSAQEGLLESLIRSGKTARAISLEMGLNRNQVAGKVKRMRERTGDDSLRVGLSEGRIGHYGEEWVKFRNPESNPKLERLYAWRAANPRRKPSSNGGLVTSIKATVADMARRAKDDRRTLAKAMMHGRICCCPDPVHFTERAFGFCAWPIYMDDAPFSEKLCCNNPVLKSGPYCAAHAQQAYGYTRGLFNGEPAKRIKANRWSIATGRKVA
jgi:hypothetical protein